MVSLTLHTRKQEALSGPVEIYCAMYFVFMTKKDELRNALACGRAESFDAHLWLE